MLFCLGNDSTKLLARYKNSKFFKYSGDSLLKMKNKTAIITGAAKNIGAKIAEDIHSMGMNVIIHYNHSEKEALKLSKNLNNIRDNSAIAIKADLKKNDSCSYLIDTAINFKKDIDVLINNASAFYPTSLEKIDEDSWNELINTNLKAPLFLSKLASKSLKKNNGCIINITDIHALNPLKEHIIYSISKAGLIALTKSLAKELAPNVRVNAISPGAITWPEQMDVKTKDAIMDQIVLKKIGSTKDIANTVIFLIKDADYMTGQIVNVDGGKTLFP